MNETAANIAGNAPAFLNSIPMGKQLWPVLVALAILIIGMIIAKIVKSLVLKALGKVSVLKREAADGSVTDLASPIASLVYFVLVLFVLIAALGAMGLTDVLEPLKGMVSQFMAYIPKIIGAGIVGYIGWILANIISEFVGVALLKADEQLALRTGNSDMKVSKIGSAFVFAAILLPIVVAALGILDIEAISAPATAMIHKLMAAIPSIIAAAIILAVTYFVARFVIIILNGIFEGMNIDSMPEKMGMQGLFTPTFTPTKLIGNAIMFFSMLTAATAAVEKLNIEIISQIMAKVLEFGGGILVGGVILIIGNFLSNLAYKHLSSSAPSLANIARIAILGLVLAMGLRAMGLADNIVNMAFGFTLAAVAVSAALAFGLGGRDAAKKVADKWASKID
jgi:hypothetical protein